MKEHTDNAGIITHPPVFYFLAIILGLVFDKIYPLSFIFREASLVLGIINITLGVLVIAVGGKIFLKHRQNPSVHASSSQIFQSGIFGYSRNPIYLGMLLLVLGVALQFNILWIAIFMVPLILVMNRLVIEKEEIYLARKFGEKYFEYKKCVRRWI
jgi:protein-S-isoprenylcysteine O-methyltransferase Ste14